MAHPEVNGDTTEELSEARSELGSLEDLRRVAALEVPEVSSLEEAYGFLTDHQVIESFVAALDTYGEGNEIKKYVAIGNLSTSAYHFSCDFALDLLDPTYTSHYLSLRSGREVRGSQFNYAYYLSLPIYKTRFVGSPAIDQRASPDIRLYYDDKTPGSGFFRDGTALDLLNLVKDAAGELAINIEHPITE